MLDQLSLLFEFSPVVLGIIAIPAILLSNLTNSRFKLQLLAIICCILLIIAQTGWIQAYITNTPTMMTLFDKVWTVFNILSMTFFISWAQQQST